TFRPPAATAWPRCWPSSATPRSAPWRERADPWGAGRQPRGTAADPRVPAADGLPDLHDPVLPVRGGHRGLARLRTHPRPLDAGPDRPGRGAALLLRRAVRRTPGGRAAAAPAGRDRRLRAGDHAAAAGGHRR